MYSHGKWLTVASVTEVEKPEGKGNLNKEAYHEFSFRRGDSHSNNDPIPSCSSS